MTQPPLVPANGANIPAIGFGTWTLTDDLATRMVAVAIDAGYRHVDTAAMYGNEAAVGAGLRASAVPRDEVFLTTKVWPSDLADGDLQRSVENSLKQLGTGYVDLALIHWPSKTVPLEQSIRALNEVQSTGMARNIGVSNFPTALLEEAVGLSDRPIACNQIEYHPFLNQDRVLATCRAYGIAVVAYCPLARGSELGSEPVITAAAERLGRSPAQIALRWHMQQDGVVAIPRSSNPERIAENLDVFDFALTPDEMTAISALGGRRRRICDFEFAPDWDPA